MQLAMARVGAKTHILQQISMLDLGRILRFVVHQFFKLLIDEKLLVNRSRRVKQKMFKVSGDGFVALVWAFAETNGRCSVEILKYELAKSFDVVKE